MTQRSFASLVKMQILQTLVAFLTVFQTFSFGPFDKFENYRGPCPQIVSRREWGAEYSKPFRLAKRMPKYIVIHLIYFPNECTTIEACSKLMRNLQFRDQVLRLWSDIGLNFAVGTDYRVYEGRGWDRYGNHIKRFNRDSIGLGVIGNYRSRPFPEEMERTILTFIRCSAEENRFAKNYKIVAHKQLSETWCPGDAVTSGMTNWPYADPYLLKRTIGNVSKQKYFH